MNLDSEEVLSAVALSAERTGVYFLWRERVTKDILISVNCYIVKRSCPYRLDDRDPLGIAGKINASAVYRTPRPSNRDHRNLQSGQLSDLKTNVKLKKESGTGSTKYYDRMSL
jgi:hypothetical protein